MTQNLRLPLRHLSIRGPWHQIQALIDEIFAEG